MTFSSDLEKEFGTTDLYQILDLIDKKCTSAKIKRAYFQMALKYHPDKAVEGSRDEANVKFQLIGRVYAILSDVEQRTLYDETGMMDHEIDTTKDRDWAEYWRLLFPKVNVADIEKFKATYQNSQEETEDVKKAYVEAEGDLDFMFENVLCSTEADMPRFIEIVNDAIANNELQLFKKWKKSSSSTKKAKKRSKRASVEAREAEEHAKALGLNSSFDAIQDENNSENTLRQIIASRQASREASLNGMLYNMEQKYGKKKKFKQNKQPSPPSEEEFLAMRAKIDARRQGR